MTLESIKAECKEHEPRTDELHSKMDKLSGSSSSEKAPGSQAKTATRTIAITVAVAATLIVAGLYLMTVDQSDDVLKHYPPVIDSCAFINDPNGMKIWINASDPDDSIINVTVQVSAKAPNNSSYLWPPAYVEVYWVNSSSAHVEDILLLGGLPAGGYRISTYATDASGNVSEAAGFVEFTV